MACSGAKCNVSMIIDKRYDKEIIKYMKKTYPIYLLQDKFPELMRFANNYISTKLPSFDEKKAPVLPVYSNYLNSSDIKNNTKNILDNIVIYNQVVNYIHTTNVKNIQEIIMSLKLKDLTENDKSTILYLINNKQNQTDDSKTYNKIVEYIGNNWRNIYNDIEHVKYSNNEIILDNAIRYAIRKDLKLELTDKDVKKIIQMITEKRITTSPDKKLWQGTYGCVYYPAVKCDVAYGTKTNEENKQALKMFEKYTANPNKYVTKYMAHKDVLIEVKLSNLLKHIDPERKYFAYLEEGLCKSLQLKDSERSQCKAYNKYKNSLEFVAIYMPYGGSDVDRWINNLKNTTILNEEFKEIKNKDVLITKLFIHACKGLDLLHKNNIVHIDIKPGNMLITNEGKGNFDNLSIKFADFGMAISKDTPFGGPYDSFFYYVWPPDFILMQNTTDIWKSMVNDYKNLTVTYKTPLINPIKASVKKDELIYWMDYIYNKNKLNYYKTVDIYGLGITFVIIFTELGIKIPSYVESLLYKMIDANPYIRWKINFTTELSKIL